MIKFRGIIGVDTEMEVQSFITYLEAEKGIEEKIGKIKGAVKKVQFKKASKIKDL